MKYPEPKAPDTEGLPELPEGWCWGTLEQISWDSGYGTSIKCDYENKGIPIIRIPNISNGSVILSNMKYSSEHLIINDTSKLLPCDFLIVRTNGSKELIGRASLIKEPLLETHYYASYLIRYRLLALGMIPEWVNSIWNSPRNRSWIIRKVATTAGQYNISLAKINKLPIEIPPLDEQRRIIQEIQSCLSIAENLEQLIEDTLKRVDKLRNGTLKLAFIGGLDVPKVTKPRIGKN
jgi:type I restriction enzyme, S subunit